MLDTDPWCIHNVLFTGCICIGPISSKILRNAMLPSSQNHTAILSPWTLLLSKLPWPLPRPTTKITGMQYRHSSPANAHEQCHQTVGPATSPVGCFHAPWNGRRRSVEGSSRYSALEIQNFCLHPVALWPCSKQVFFVSLEQIHKKCCSAEKAKWVAVVLKIGSDASSGSSYYLPSFEFLR